jgi:hypothetical protein
MRWKPSFSRSQSHTRLYQHITRLYTFETSPSRLMVIPTLATLTALMERLLFHSLFPATTAIMGPLSLRKPIPTPNHLRRTAWNDRQFHTQRYSKLATQRVEFYGLILASQRPFGVCTKYACTLYSPVFHAYRRELLSSAKYGAIYLLQS